MNIAAQQVVKYLRIWLKFKRKWFDNISRVITVITLINDMEINLWNLIEISNIGYNGNVKSRYYDDEVSSGLKNW